MKYTKPVAELEKFQVMDVITTSDTTGGDGKIDTGEDPLD